MITTVSPGNILNHTVTRKNSTLSHVPTCPARQGAPESAAATFCSVETINDTLPHPPPRLRGEPSKSFLSIC